jgi:hypothetical protein
MHTSYLTLFLFLGGLVGAAVVQIVNYSISDQTGMRKLALGVGLVAVLLTGLGGYRASIDWSALPTSSEGLQRGQLWNDGGIPAITP